MSINPTPNEEHEAAHNAHAQNGTVASNHPLFKALLKGVFVGFILAFIFILIASLLTSLGSTFTFLTSIPDMALFGFFIGIGMETYPVLV